mmetsp:Transcript_30878/g.5570  ORF Transcript_30878/g.5570 Transcript_30878/m.5570 type:complete len:104 (+) Transcript_30878:262-573(+)
MIKTRLKGQLKMRAELYTKKVLGPVVYENCAGFIRIPFENFKSDPLDSTRVHPADYSHAIKIAASVFESNSDNLDKDYMIQKVMENSAMLDELDIGGYIELLK